jgi:hypothetical protein
MADVPQSNRQPAEPLSCRKLLAPDVQKIAKIKECILGSKE